MTLVTPRCGFEQWTKSTGGLPVTANLIAWYDPSDWANRTLSNGYLAGLTDKSGNGYHLAQLSAGNQPSLASAAQNGLDAANFGAASACYFNIASTITINTYTCFLVINKTSGQIANGFCKGNGAPSFTPAWGGAVGNPIYTANTSGLIYTSAAQILNGYNVITTQITTGLAGAIWTNGTSLSLSSAADVKTMGWNNFGYWGQTNQYTNCYFGEIILYNSVLSGADVASIQSYLKAKWGTP